MTEKFVEVLGGYTTGGSDDDGPSRGKEGVFTVKKRVIVPESELAALFRRDWELCGMQTIKLLNTNHRPY